MGNLICKLFGHKFNKRSDAFGWIYMCTRKHCTATKEYVSNPDGTYTIIVTECTCKDIQ